MSKYTTISAKISEKESEEIKKLKLNPTMILPKDVTYFILGKRNCSPCKEQMILSALKQIKNRRSV